jgi:hypothetical protein
MKECFKCHIVKPLSEYYKHPGTTDGHLGKCKTCTKTDVHKHRDENLEKIQAYDRKRGNRQGPEYWTSEAYKVSHTKAVRNYRKKNPNRLVAYNAVSEALELGDLVKKACEVCGAEKSEAHHEDYDKPLEVNWLCDRHHKDLHKKKRGH